MSLRRETVPLKLNCSSSFPHRILFKYKRGEVLITSNILSYKKGVQLTPHGPRSMHGLLLDPSFVMGTISVFGVLINERKMKKKSIKPVDIEAISTLKVQCSFLMFLQLHKVCYRFIVLILLIEIEVL